jgi:hypothetical protein
VHTDQGPLKFEKRSENLYCFQPKHLMNNVAAQLVQTVEENKSFYTDKQVEKAKKPDYDLKTIIKMKSIKNCPVTVADVDLAEKIFGKDAYMIHLGLQEWITMTMNMTIKMKMTQTMMKEIPLILMN